jgi:cytochrome c biogenesis protein CcdA
MPLVQVVSIIVLESAYFAYLVRNRVKYKTPYKTFSFVLGLMESFCILNFMVYSLSVLIRQHKNENWEQREAEVYEIGVLVSILVIVLL